MTTRLPRSIGSYRVIAQLGQGGMARALLAVRQGPGGFRKLFVIKQLRPDFFHERAFIEMFLDEARLAAMLSHPNVVQAHEVGGEGGECFISMDFLEGQSLSRVLRKARRPQVPLALHIHILSEVLAGLHYAHQLADYDGSPLDVVHRDVSPGNVFVTYDGEVKLLDFGIAKAGGASFQTEVGVLKGKLAYMAPEQAHAQEVDRRSDIFSVGVMLWEALAERRMVEPNEPEPVTLNNRVNGLWPAIASVRPDAPPALVSACERAMSLSPADRFASADLFRGALTAWLAGLVREPHREDVADFVGAHFADDRAKLGARIAEAMGDEEEAAERDTTPRRRATTDLPVWDPESPISPSLLSIPQRQEPVIPTSAPSSGRRALIAVAAAAAVAIALAAFAYSRGGRSSEAVAGEADGAASTEVSVVAVRIDAAASVTETIRVEITAVPRTATIAIDGEAVGSNPLTIDVARDANAHRLVVTADGFDTEVRVLRYEADISLEIALVETVTERVSAADGRRARATRIAAEQAEAQAAADAKTAAAQAAKEAEKARLADATKTKKPVAGDALIAPGGKQARPIDKENPYK